MSIRVRLTLWYTLVLSVILAAIGFAIYNVFVAVIGENVDRKLNETAALVFSVSTVSRLGEVRIPVAADVFRSAGLYLQVIDPLGRVVGMSDSLRGYDKPINPAVLSLDLADFRPVRHDVREGDVHLRVLPCRSARQGRSSAISRSACKWIRTTSRCRSSRVSCWPGG